MCVAYDPATLWVNKHGKRFANENIVWWFSVGGNAVYRQPGKICYSIFDESTRRKILKEGFTEFYQGTTTMMIGSTLMPKKFGIIRPIRTFRKKKAQGNIKITDSFEEIARFIGADPEVLKSTIDQYNSSCDRGHDDLFAKDIEFLLPSANTAVLCNEMRG